MVPAVWIQVQWQWLHLNITAGSILPKFLVLTMWPNNPFGHGSGAFVPFPAVGGQLRLWPGCQLRQHWAPWCGGMLSPAPTALLKLTQHFQSKFFCWSIWEKMLCARYAAVTQTVFGDIGSALFPYLLGCALNRILNLYSQGYLHIFLFIRKMLSRRYLFSFCRCRSFLFC